MPKYLIITIAIGIILLGLCLLWLARRKWQQVGLPEGRLAYTDPGLWGKPEKPFYDANLRLTGKPDYVIEQKGALLPIEVKSAWAPPAPYDNHILQLGAYCLLIEKTTGKRPPLGILKYRNRIFTINYTRALEDLVMEIVQKIRKQKMRGEASRSHEEARRCARCGFRVVCRERL